MWNLQIPIKAGIWYPTRHFAKPQVGGTESALRAGLVAGAVAGMLSGAPSTVHALLTGRDPLALAHGLPGISCRGPFDWGPRADRQP